MSRSRDERIQVWLAILAAVIVLTGIQPILPALPVMQRELGLSDSQIALVTSAYLLPGVLLALPLGLLADRIGRHLVYSVGLSIFGLCALVFLFTRSFPMIIGTRIVQGIAFAAVIPLSITMIGDVHHGAHQLAAQGRRSAAMAIGDAGLPVIGGLMVGLAWFTPFMLQLIAIPLAIAGWFLLARDFGVRRPSTLYLRQLYEILRARTSLTLQLSGFLRFLFKFAMITYLPILLVAKRGMSPAFVGLALGGTALCGIAAGVFSGHLAHMAAPSRLIGLSLVAIGVSFIAISLVTSTFLVIAVCLIFGVADGTYGVCQNAMTAQATSTDFRAAFIGASGSVRNLGKFLAPVILGLSVLVLPLEASFVLMGLLALIALITVPWLSHLDRRLATDQLAQLDIQQHPGG
jgi:MFS family permease